MKTSSPARQFYVFRHSALLCPADEQISSFTLFNHILADTRSLQPTSGAQRLMCRAGLSRELSCAWSGGANSRKTQMIVRIAIII